MVIALLPSIELITFYQYSSIKGLFGAIVMENLIKLFGKGRFIGVIISWSNSDRVGDRKDAAVR